MRKMTPNEVANALGLHEVEYQPSDQAGSNIYETLWINADESYCYGCRSEMRKWIESAEGQAKIRDKVRAECRRLNYGLTYWYGEMFNFSHKHAIKTGIHFTDNEDTESAAWLSALEYLNKHKGAIK